ncbi:MAG: alkaline phosphatase D family protein, partial [Mycobacteriales bacterium]
MSSPVETPLVLGPMLRYVDTTTATVWLQTSTPCRVRVVAGHCAGSGRTFAVHGHHYALIDVTGLTPGTLTPYTVCIDDEPVWPRHDADLPAPTIRTADDRASLRLLWGSCRRAAGDDEAATAAHGVDALRSYALQLAAAQSAGRAADDGSPWPNQLLLLGDQIYADAPSEPMREFIDSRRDASRAPGHELADFTEYAQAYRLAWSEPVIAWLLSCVPSMMIFDDHDVRDDWNTSAAWRDQMRATSWWRARIVSGLSSYWIYQHAGNLSPRQRSTDMFGRLAAEATESGADIGARFDELAAAIDDDPECYSFSYARQLASVTFVMLDSRCGRVLEPGKRDMLNEPTWQWMERQLTGGSSDDSDRAPTDRAPTDRAPTDRASTNPAPRHLVIASSLPVLLPPTLHYAEQWNEAVCDGAWGSRFGRLAERLRQAIDLEHWSAFRRSFHHLFGLIAEVATGQHGRQPSSIQLLGGDVHFSYLMRATLCAPPATNTPQPVSPIYQLVCSPTRNPMARWMKYANFLAAWRWPIGLARLVART